MGDNYLFKYNVDMVFCIDATASMRPVLNTVKNNALNFYHDVTEAMEKKGKHINEMRIRVIAFRDYLADADAAMMTTDFFRLPEQSADFEKCVKSIQPKGGGDTPEDGVEALAYAIKSKWTTGGDKKRNIIVVWTDASTHELGYGKKSSCYPSGMAGSFGELTSWWGDEQCPGQISDSSKRLILFTPYEKEWSVVTENWNNVIHYPSVAGNGLGELDYKEIIDAIGNSI